MTAAPTSRLAYKQVLEDGIALPQMQQIYELLMTSMGLTRYEIHKRLGMRLSSVCARVRELIQANMAFEIQGETRFNKDTGKENQVIRAKKVTMDGGIGINRYNQTPLPCYFNG